MKNQVITTINGVNIVTVERKGEIFVPIKPICEAIGIDAKHNEPNFRKTHFLLQPG